MTTSQPYDFYVMDLDDTLYSSECGIISQIDERILAYLSWKFDIARADAIALRDTWVANYGNTLTAVKVHPALDHLEYLAFVHDVNLDAIDGNTLAGRYCCWLAGQVIVFTNATKLHTHRVMRKLQLEGKSLWVHSIEDSLYIPKPDKRAYDRLIERFNLEPGRCLFVDDSLANLYMAKETGFYTAYVGAYCLEYSKPWDYVGDNVHTIMEQVWRFEFPKGS